MNFRVRVSVEKRGNEKTTLSQILVVTMRFFLVPSKGALFPCNHAIWSKWAPPAERTRLFTITVAGK